MYISICIFFIFYRSVNYNHLPCESFVNVQSCGIKAIGAVQPSLPPVFRTSHLPHLLPCATHTNSTPRPAPQPLAAATVLSVHEFDS